MPTSRQLKRLGSVNRSPIYSHFSETIQGASTIRAYKKTSSFNKQLQKKLDCFTRIQFLTSVADRWISFRLEMIGNFIVLFSTLFAVIVHENNLDVVSVGLIGLSISYALNVCFIFKK